MNIRTWARPRILPLLPFLLIVAASLVVAGCVQVRDPLEFSPTTLPDGQVGVSYAQTITVSHAATPVGGVSVQDGSLPPGLDVNLGEQHDNVVHVTGTPSAAGTYTFTIYVWCYGTQVSGQTATQAYTLVVR